MKITIFGLTLSSSWGNGHATPYRAILRALHARGVQVTFYEKDVAYYAAHRDFSACNYCRLQLYSDWSGIRLRALLEARDSDIVVTASYCPDGARISDEILELHGPLHVFYDLDTPVTLKALSAGPLDYLRREQISEFDLYLSFTGGELLRRLQQQYGARMARPLFGCVDPDAYRPVDAQPAYACSLSYLGTYAADRQKKLDSLFLEPARLRGDLRFLLGGSLYPWDWTWPENVLRIEHVAAAEHPPLYSSSSATLNLTRQEMAASGYCPSGRLFEAAACGTPLLTDWWQGLDQFFNAHSEITVVRTADEVLSALAMTADLHVRARRARERTLDEHTGARRASELLAHCEEAKSAQQLMKEASA